MCEASLAVNVIFWKSAAAAMHRFKLVLGVDSGAAVTVIPKRDFVDYPLLANERTYGGWMRTALASLGIALGFHAIFNLAERAWLAKGGATLFVAIAIGIIILAHRNAYEVMERMERHDVEALRSSRLWIITTLLVGGAVLLGALLWMI